MFKEVVHSALQNQKENDCIYVQVNSSCLTVHRYNRLLGYERVYLSLCEVADTPFHIQGDAMYIHEEPVINYPSSTTVVYYRANHNTPGAKGSLRTKMAPEVKHLGHICSEGRHFENQQKVRYSRFCKITPPKLTILSIENSISSPKINLQKKINLQNDECRPCDQMRKKYIFKFKFNKKE